MSESVTSPVTMRLSYWRPRTLGAESSVRDWHWGTPKQSHARRALLSKYMVGNALVTGDDR